MPIPDEWDFRSLPNEDEITVQHMLIAGLVEKAPEVIFLQRIIEEALSATLRQPAEFGVHRDRAVANILLNFGKEHGPKPPIMPPVAGPQFPGQAYPGKPIVSDSDRGRALYTPVGPIHVGDVLEHWDTPSGPTSAETWIIENIEQRGVVHARSTVSRGITTLQPTVWQVGGPWRIQTLLPTTSEQSSRWFAANARPGWLIERVEDGKRFRVVGLHDGDVLTATITEPPQAGPTFKVTDWPSTIVKIEEEA